MYPILVELVDNGFDWNILISLLGALGVLYGAVTGLIHIAIRKIESE